MIKIFIISFPILFVIQLILFPSESQAKMFTYGDEDSEVVEIQKKLIKMDYLYADATGYYGMLTTEAIKQFQRDFHLNVDGIAGPQTIEKLRDVEKVARIVHGEARGESYEGQVAVASVVKNRILSNQFPSTVDGVIFQKNAFTAVMDGQYDLDPNKIAYLAVKDAWKGWDPTYGSTYYYNPTIATSEWIFTRTTKLKIGQHVFAE